MPATWPPNSVAGLRGSGWRGSRPATVSSRRGSLVGVLVALLLTACATTGEQTRPGLQTAHQAVLGNVAVVATETAPELRFAGFARSKGEGAASAGGAIFGQCLGNIGHCSGDFCGVALIFMLGVCGVAGLVGGIAGAAEAPPADSVAGDVSQMTEVVEARQIQRQMRRTIEDAAAAAGTVVVRVPEAAAQAAVAAGDYRPLARFGADNVLETTLTQVGTAGIGIDDPVSLFMQARVRVVDTVANQPLFTANYEYVGRRLKHSAWAANQGQPLRAELERGYQRLGEHIRDSVFDLFPFPDRDWHSAGGMLSVSFGLAPIEPPTRGAFTGERFIGSLFEWYEADSTRPRMRWQAFPRTGDIAAAPEIMARVKNVTYDLLIAREVNMAPAEIVYRREGLAEPEHTVVGGLQPGARYFWTVRARFELDGRRRVTEWGTTHFLIREQTTAPSQYSYRFRTPE